MVYSGEVKEKNTKKETPFMTALAKKIATKLGAKIIVEPVWQYAGKMIYKNGVVRSINFNSIDINAVASSQIAKDKDFSKFFMKSSGYNVAEGFTVFEKSWASTIGSDRDKAYALVNAEKKLGFPLILKPNARSQGEGVFLIQNKKELGKYLDEVCKMDRVALLEKYLPGRDFRFVVFDGSVLAVYEREALSVVGDGVNNIAKLLENKQKLFQKLGRKVWLEVNDKRIILKLKRSGLTLKSIPNKGEKVFLLDNANLSSGGEAVDMTHVIHKSFKDMAIKLTAQMGLTLAGVDMMLQEGNIENDIKKSKFYILEINATPGFEHYASLGPSQRAKIENLYFKVFKSLGKK